MPTQKELNDKYGNNLSATSNDTELILRDPGGNLILPDGNESIYIEPVRWEYENNSVNNIINTRFSYYKFPPKLVVDDEIPEEIDIEPIDIKYYSRYQAEPQLVPTIDLFNGNGNELAYGPADSAGKQKKYPAAQSRADYEVENGISLGRYNISYNADLPGWDIKSLFEGHFLPIKFTELLDGTPSSKPGKFIITQNMFDQKKSFQFNIKVSISHTDNHLRNSFMVRLVRGRDNGVYNQYNVVKLTSTAVEGTSWQKSEGLSKQQLTEMTSKKIAMDAAKNTLDIATVTYNEKATQATKYQNDVVNPIYTEYKAAYETFIAMSGQKVDDKQFQAAKSRLIGLESIYTSVKKKVDKLTDDVWNVYRVAMINAETAYNTAAAAYKNLAYVVNNDVTDPEFVLNAQTFSYWPGRTEFTLQYTVVGESSKLYDTYWVEMLASKPTSNQHELLEEQTFWDIREL